MFKQELKIVARGPTREFMQMEISWIERPSVPGADFFFMAAAAEMISMFEITACSSAEGV
jgi:histidyl-tRNA synthetase